ncbi:hypothetical protein KDA82_07780 [Streptomyces daliensis]|uniref:Uncharacterized protein n=1 Tax=Streptomyces daliensis TaxID=299421 RepID=A0A8T4IKT4_9ACTN|nr:hypothetical protein [Streptomyces daliensis]
MAKRADVAVLFVHGIGDQGQGDTLESFSGPLLGTLRQLVDGTGVLVADARLDPGGRIGVALRQGDVSAMWLLSEAWWAKSFSAPSYGQLARWLALAGPQTLYRHALRYKIVPRPARNVPVASALYNSLLGVLYLWLPVFLWRRVFYPALMVAVALVVQVLFLLLIPLASVPLLRRVIQRVQYLLVATVGDSLAFVDVPESFERMVDQVREELRTLDAVASNIVVVAHSQGAAVAHAALRREPLPSERVLSFVTLGAGLDKLTVLRAVGDDGVSAVVRHVGPLWAAPPVLGMILLGAWTPGGVQAALATIAAYGFFLASAFLPLRYYRRLQRSIDEQLPLPGQGERLEWLDVYASADPVPHGPLLPVEERPWTLQPERANVASFEVRNHRSPLTDHTTYQRNTEQVMLPLLDLVCSLTPLWLTRTVADYPRLLERGWARRTRRTGWRARTRLSALLALWGTVTPPTNAVAPLPLLLGALVCLHLAAGAAWRRWDRAESAAWLDHGTGQVRRARALFFVVAGCPLALLAGLQLLVTGDRALAGFFGVLLAVVWGWGAPGALWRTVRG